MLSESDGTDDEPRKNMKVRKSTWRAFKDAKPFESMSHDEFLRELLNSYEGHGGAP